MNLSIVIKCHRDPLVAACVESIACPGVEIIIATTPGDPSIEMAAAWGAEVVTAPVGAIGATTAAGVDACSNDHVVITDSDSRFSPDYLPRMHELLDRYDIARGRLVTDTVPGWRGFNTRLVARSRDHIHNHEKHMFMPGLALRRSIAPRLGGQLFDASLVRAVDFDFEQRARAAGCSFCFDDSVVIAHAPVQPSHDLRAAWSTGKSTCGLIRRGRVAPSKYYETRRALLTCLGVGHVQRYRDLSRRIGVTATVYQHVWTVAFHLGYLVAARRP
jgi:hypothetical protein